MAWRTTNVTIMDPNALAAQLDADTDRLYGGHQRKRNPYPKMRLTDGSAPRSKPKAAQKKDKSPLPQRLEIAPECVYIVDLKSADLEEVASKVLADCAYIRALWPTFRGEPAYPGYLAIATDHPMTSDEKAKVKRSVTSGGCELLRGPLPKEEADGLLLLSRTSEARKGA